MENVSSSNGLEKRPKLRFPGFESTSWCSQKIGEYLTSRNEKQIPTEDAPLMAFTAEDGVTSKGERYDRSFLVKSKDKQYKRTKLNDFIYSSNNLDVGSIGLNKYGTAVISDVYEIFSVNSKAIPTFASEMIQRPRVLSDILKYRQGCLYGQYRIYADDFLGVLVNAPSFEEQKKISAFLEKIDAKIAQHKRLVEALKKYKRGLLSYYFSTKHTEHLGDVESYIFADIAYRRTEKYDPRSGKDAICIELEHLDQETGRILGTVPAKNQNSIKNVCKKGDVLFGKLRPYLRKYAFVKQDCVCSSEIWALVPTERVLPQFLFYLAQSENFIRVANISTGTKMPRAEWTNVEKGVFYIPPIVAQQAIVLQLEGIDALIANNDEVCEHLKKLKDGLLQQLFI